MVNRSIIGSFAFSSRNKYFIQAGGNYNQSSQYQGVHQWIFLPSVSLKWDMKQEPLLKDSRLSMLQIRSSYGKNGQSGLKLDENFSTIPTSQFIGNGDRFSDGYAVLPSNSGWENNTAMDVGIEFGWKQNKWRGSINWSKISTENLYLIVRQPFGVSSFRVQGGNEVENRNVAIVLQGKLIQKKQTSLSIQVNVGANRNEVLSLGEHNQLPISNFVYGQGYNGAPIQVVKVGFPITGAFVGKKFIGIDTVTGEKYATPSTDLPISVGNNLEIIGRAEPQFRYGCSLDLNVKDIEATVFFRGQVGGKVFNNTSAEHGYAALMIMQGRNGIIPKDNVEIDDLANVMYPPGFASDRWLEDASFLRLDQIMIAYKPKSLSSKMRMYVSGQNLFTFTSYSGYDPEVISPYVGVDYMSIPRMKTVSIGFDYTF